MIIHTNKQLKNSMETPLTQGPDSIKNPNSRFIEKFILLIIVKTEKQINIIAIILIINVTGELYNEKIKIPIVPSIKETFSGVSSFKICSGDFSFPNLALSIVANILFT